MASTQSGSETRPEHARWLVIVLVLASGVTPLLAYGLLFGRVDTRTPAQAKRHLAAPDRGAVLVDVRCRDTYEAGHLAGATNWPLQEILAVDSPAGVPAAFRGKTLLIVNVASKCGFTPQYTGLEALYRRQKDAGLEILAFPCDQFGHQEPGDEQEIKTFCTTKYDVTFPLFAKIEVNGKHADPLFEYLKSEGKGVLGSESIKWNFTKFLVDWSGRVVKRYGSMESPESIAKDIEALL